MTKRCAVTVVAMLAPLLAGIGAYPAGATTQTAATKPELSTSGTTGLPAGRPVRFTVSGATPGAALVAVQCTPQALQILENACNNRRDTLVFADRAGKAAGSFTPTPEMQTAAGAANCTTSACLFAVAQIGGGGAASVVGVDGLSFASNVTASSPAGPSGGPPAPRLISSPVVASGPVIGVGTPSARTITAGVAPSIDRASAMTGPNRPTPNLPAPRKSVSGQGIIELTMTAPGTSWEDVSTRSVVVDVAVDGGPSQQIVCFAGASGFTYAGFTGPLTTGRHRVTVAVDPSLSRTGGLPPEVRLIGEQLAVVTPSNPWYDAVAFAPVVYGRSDGAANDTPLLTYVDQSPAAAGRHLSYTTIWSKEAQGTAFVPFLEWGEWGRMTDITGTVSLTASSTGAISGPAYNWCGCQAGYPENEASLQEVSVPFTGSYFATTHAIVRNASGNDYQSQSGTTAFRIQQVPVPGRAPGATRASVMDAHPWTYLVSAQENSRWYTNGSTDPLSPQIGDSRQYAIIDLQAHTSKVSAVAVAIRLSGSSRWYKSDLGSGFPLHSGGHGRTAVKLPLGWQSHRIVGLELSEYPAGPGASVSHVRVGVLGLTSDFSMYRPASPKVRVVRG